jgi:NADPH:quinone reductase-like Zn-dependent oxidoreductase
MRAVVVSAYGSTDVLKVEDIAAPVLEPNQVRIQVHAAGVNFADVMSRLGHYSANMDLPYIGGFEVSGVVTEIPPEGSGLAVGDRVAAMTRRGAFAEEVCIDQRDVIVLPDSISFTEGAAVPAAYSTAWAGLIGYGNVQPGERVLVMAAAGGVGIAAVQLAKNAGAVVWGAASPGKHEAILELGVDTAVDYTKPGWEEDLPPFDLVMDAIGGDSFKRSYDLLRPGGRLVAFGAVSVFDGGVRKETEDFRTIRGLSSAEQMIDSKTIIGLDQRVLWDDRDTLQPWLAPLVPLLESKAIRPIVSDVITYAEAAEAHQILTDRRNIGKVVLVP